MAEEEKILKEAKKLPWDERIAHKNWKVRNDAYIDLAAACEAVTDPKDPRLRDYGPLFKKAVSDSNAPAQEKALDALICFLQRADADAGRYGKEVCHAIAAKCLVGRPKTLQKSVDALLLFVELEASEAFLDAMEEASKNKLAKVVVPAVDAIFQAVSQFGVKVVNAKRVIKMLPPLFDHQDQKVRASAKALTVELCRWVGKGNVQSLLLSNMRDTMKKEIEAEIENVKDGVAHPERRIRSEQAKAFEMALMAADVSTTTNTEAAPAEGPPEFDDYDLADPVDILSQLKSTFWDGVKSKKWSERKEAVGELVQLASARKLASGDYTEVVRVLKKMIADINVAVVVEAVNATGNLGRGLRKEFGGYARILLPGMLDKLKEKKQTVLKALQDALQTLHKSGCVNIVELTEELKPALEHKVPSVRKECVDWIKYCVETSTRANVLKILKAYIDFLIKAVDDSAPDVRDASFATLAALARAVSMKPLEKAMDKLDDVKKKKLNDLIASLGGAPVIGSAPAPVAAAAPRSVPPSVQQPAAAANGNDDAVSEAGSSSGGSDVAKRSVSSIQTTASLRKPMARSLSVKRGPSGGSSKSSAGKRGDNGMSGGPPAESDDVEPTDMSAEEVEAKVSEFLPTEMLGNLKSVNWKERLEAMNTLKELVEGFTDEQVETNAEFVTRLLVYTPGWADKNVQVVQKMLETVTVIIQKIPLMTKRCAAICIAGVIEKVGDIKLRIQSIACLTAYCEAVGPQFVFNRMYKLTKEHRNPKVLSEGVLFMVSAIDEFGLTYLKMKDLLDFARDFCLQSSVPAVRNGAVKLLGVVHKWIGPDLKNFLTDVKPAQMGILETEFAKNPYEGSPAANRTVRAPVAVDGGGGGVGVDGLPREDITPKVTAGLLKGFSSSDWKVRQDSIHGVDRILEEANKRILPNGTGELFAALKSRLNDSNKNLTMTALGTLGNLACAIGPPADKASKGIVADALKCLSDNKKQMRDAVLKMLTSFHAACGVDKLAPYVAGGLSDAKICADGRRDLLSWTAKQVPSTAAPQELLCLVKPLSTSLQDKSAEVRKAAEELLMAVIAACGYDVVAKAAKQEGAAVANSLNPYLDKNRSGAPIDDLAAPRGGSKTSTRGGKTSTAGRKSDDEGGRTKSAVSGVRGARGAPASTARKQVSADAARDAALQSEPLFVANDLKDDRERKCPRKIKFEDPRPEQVADLEQLMAPFFRDDLHRRLFSPDFKKQVEGLDLMQKAIPQYKKEIVDNLDLLLRWSVLRFCESNTTAILKVLEFLPELVEALVNEGYHLREYEANIFLPCLVEKCGHNIDKVREKMRELMRQISSIYPPSRLFAFIVEGVRSKNNRTRVECVDQLGSMIDRHGIEIVGSTKALQAIAGLVSERDAAIRNAALTTLATAYKILGDDVWKQLGRLADAQKGLVDDKFKWKAREMERNKEGKPGEARALAKGRAAAAVRSTGPEAEQSGDTRKEMAAHAMGARTANGHFAPAAAGDHHVHGGEPEGRPSYGPTDWKQALEYIHRGSTNNEVVEGMKLVCQLLSSASSDPTVIQTFAPDADRLVEYLTSKVTHTFNLGLNGASARSCKYVLNTLMQTFQIKDLASMVQQTSLGNLIAELLIWLLNEKVPQIDDGGQLLKALNVLMLKILENANRTSSFVVLIGLLRPYKREVGPPALTALNPEDTTPGSRMQRFSDLVVKCLIRLTKALGSTINDVDLDRLLQSIHDYLQELGLDEIRRRAGADDKPLRMVKTVLHELVKLQGPNIKGHLSLVPIDMEPQPIIMAYIDLNLQTLAAAKLLTPAGHADSGTNGATSPTAGGGSTDSTIKQELAMVFKKIGDKQTSTAGLYELYRLTQHYPQVDINAHLMSASEAFRMYIKDGLAKVEKTMAASRATTMGSGGMSMAVVPSSPSGRPYHVLPEVDITPPAAPAWVKSLTSVPSSPRHVHMHVSSVTGDRNTGSGEEIPPPPTSKYMSSATSEHAPEKVPHAHITPFGSYFGTGTETTSGTLDSLRERMRNIQAAVAGSPSAFAAVNERLHTMSAVHANGAVSHSAAVHSSGHVPADAGPEEISVSGLQARMQRLKSGASMF
ncbi:hypothetical protein CBR_g39205 [Chara braunii]|uniref:Protein MOR1 n=1 Tax=Chara braunii TaxID=69332 RepID=A0A388LR73_CHABU|nr:hypothetical protein CBR_g39205 [Chara braunii]|eukprot:GBG84830.1 hypothetical protein CBR_g39205 [Chara braunii]